MTKPRARQQRAATLFELCVVLPTLGWLGYQVISGRAGLEPSLALWVAVVALVELAPVTFWKGMQISMGFPLLIAVAFLYSPPAAAVTALIGAFDPREIRREVPVVKALFNRCQVALAVLAASALFHSLTAVDSAWWIVLLAAFAAATIDFAVNMALVSVAASLDHQLPLGQVIKQIHVGSQREFLISYLGLGALGVVLAQLYLKVGFWAVAVFIVPLIFARQMFFRSRALEEAHKELQDREEILRALSNRMAEERQDERAQIAAYLHDDLAQLLFRLSLQVDVVARYLDQGDIEKVREMIDEVRDTKNRTSDRIRALVRDLHRSPLGRAGLGEALNSYWSEVGKASEINFKLRIDELRLPPPIQLLIYQIAREAIMNSLKYAEATEISVALARGEDSVELKIQDNGFGFDADAGEPEGHFGLTMMKERAQVAGGTLDLVSASGHGTAIIVKFPEQWLQANEATHLPGDPERAAQPAPVKDPSARQRSLDQSLPSAASPTQAPPTSA